MFVGIGDWSNATRVAVAVVMNLKIAPYFLVLVLDFCKSILTSNDTTRIIVLTIIAQECPSIGRHNFTTSSTFSSPWSLHRLP